MLEASQDIVYLGKAKPEAGGGGGGSGVAPVTKVITGQTGTTIDSTLTLSDYDTVEVFKNGVLLVKGAEADYTFSGNNIVFATALVSSDVITIIAMGPVDSSSYQRKTVVTTLTTSSTQLATNTIYNGGELASVTLTLPATVPADFIAQVEFTSGTTPTSFTAPAALYFNGDACDGGVLTPVANKRYCIMIISDGTNVLGFVYEK